MCVCLCYVGDTDRDTDGRTCSRTHKDTQRFTFLPLFSPIEVGGKVRVSRTFTLPQLAQVGVQQMPIGQGHQPPAVGPQERREVLHLKRHNGHYWTAMRSIPFEGGQGCQGHVLGSKPFNPSSFNKMKLRDERHLLTGGEVWARQRHQQGEKSPPEKSPDINVMVWVPCWSWSLFGARHPQWMTSRPLLKSLPCRLFQPGSEELARMCKKGVHLLVHEEGGHAEQLSQTTVKATTKSDESLSQVCHLMVSTLDAWWNGLEVFSNGIDLSYVGSVVFKLTGTSKIAYLYGHPVIAKVDFSTAWCRYL